jgi:hypothetical protein
MSTWHCGNRSCPTHSHPTHRCGSGVWTCRRRVPPCPGHGNPEHQCASGTAWHCGNQSCPTHALAAQRCGSGTWFCGRVSPACPGHGSRDHRCEAGAALLLAPAAGAPVPAARRGSYTVPGLGRRKQEMLAAGGVVLDIAVAMLESDDMQATYVYGDAKTGDAANFGIFKQNWMMIRTVHPNFTALGAGDYNRGAALNTDLRLDIDVLHRSQTHYGLAGGWWAGHRNGATGLANPGTPDIQGYRMAVEWIRDQLNASSDNLTNDTRFWVQVQAI